MSQPHIIQRQVLDIELPRQDRAFEIQNRISAVCRTRLSAILDEICQQLAQPGLFIQLDKLEIDLGTFASADLEEEFVNRLRANLPEILTPRVHQMSRVASSQLQIGEKAPGASIEDRLLSSDSFRLGLVQHFLQTGSLPWWAEESAIGSFDDLMAGVLADTPVELQRMLTDGLRPAWARQRLIYQLTDALLFKLVELLAPGGKEPPAGWVGDLAKIVQKAELKHLPPGEYRWMVWEAVIFGRGDPSIRKLPSEGLLQQVVKSVGRISDLGEVEVLESFQGAVRHLESAGEVLKSPVPALIDSYIRKLQTAKRELPLPARSDGREVGVPMPPAHDKKPPAEAADFQGTRPADDTGGEHLVKHHAPGLKRHTVPENIFQPGLGKQSRIEPLTGRKKEILSAAEAPAQSGFIEEAFPAAGAAAEGLGVSNAGLVILWPYLKILFDQLNLLDRNTFADDAAAMRAIHLLQYLAVGEEGSPEFLLPLNKLLCDWDLEKPVSKDVDLSDFERSECEQLLETVIGHWKALKKTSVEGLRNSFLMRKGILTNQENNWLLRVESRGYDLLLDRLPWGISMIKLSWMKKPLLVEWQ